MRSDVTVSCDKILASAASLFSAHGYHGVSVDLIAQESGVAKGTIYYHFKSKENLYFSIPDRGMDRLISKLQQITTTEGRARQRLKRQMEQIVQFFLANRSFFQILIKEERFLNGDYFLRCGDKRRAVHDLIQQIIEQGISEGAFRSVSAEHAATLLQGMIRALVLDSLERNTGKVAQELALDLFLNGLSTDGKDADE